jgi:antitoxin YefM
MPLRTLRQRLSRINRELQKSPGTVLRVTYRGKPSLAVISAELYDSIVETLDVMSDPDTAEALLGSLADIEAGRVRSLDEVARRLHLRQKPPRNKK